MRIAYTDKYLDWQLGAGHPTNPERARLAVEQIDEKLKLQEGELLEDWAHEPEGPIFWEDAVREIHSHLYVDRVLRGDCGEWRGRNPGLGQTALTMFGGTYTLVKELLDGERGVFFNPQGAKHHAHWDHSSGFCVFNDMAWAAEELTAAGRKVVYVDWDAHHGDGVEELLRGREDITTFSIHEWGIYPGTGGEDGEGYYNYPLSAEDGDRELLVAVDEIVVKVRELKADVILLACGADGLAADPLTSLRYSRAGLREAATELATAASELGADVLIGGAGGYLPHTETPAHWAETVEIMAAIVEGR